MLKTQLPIYQALPINVNRNLRFPFLVWVAQATRLSRPATCRTELGAARLLTHHGRPRFTVPPLSRSRAFFLHQSINPIIHQSSARECPLARGGVCYLGFVRNDGMMIAFLRWVVRRLYGFRMHNLEVLKTPGPVLLIPNHTSWLDWLFVGVALDEDWKFVVSSTSAETSWLHRKIMINRRTFPIDTNSPYAVKRMAEYLEGKGQLALFAEGRLSRTGVMMKLFEGTGFLLHKTGAKVITCYLRGAHRLPFSPNPNKKHLFPRVSAHFSEGLTPPHVHHMSTADARTHLTTWLRDKLIEQQFDTEVEFGPRNVLEAVAARGREFPKRVVLADINNQRLTYRVLLVGARLLAKKWTGLLRGQRIGVLLPNVNAMPVVVLSLWAAGRVPAILNYSTGTPVMLACTELAGLKQIITSRTFLGRAKINIAPLEEAGVEFLYVEDVRKTIKPSERLAALVGETFFKPGFEFSHAPEETAVILFTSGSEGVPKGVELSHRNLLANIRQMLSVIDLMDTDRFFNALPLFHSFGLTVGTLLPLVRGLFVFLYPSPLHYRVVPTAFYNLDCTVMFGRPFCRITTRMLSMVSFDSFVIAINTSPLSGSALLMMAIWQRNPCSGNAPASASSTAVRLTISPLIFAKRFSRPKMNRNPSSSIFAMSPVSYQPASFLNCSFASTFR